ncbi:MAG TPA: hypothetical protein VG757_11920 [Devosia sp.]|nr:hypothetical protein [Devosia sp.]
MSDERFRLASVAEYVTPEFPPAYISSGNGDPLAPQALRLAVRLRELGVDTDSLFFPDDLTPALPHEYQFNLDRKEGVQSFGAMLAFLQKTVP